MDDFVEEHPIRSMVGFVFMVLILLAILSYILPNKDNKYYEYIDLDNNKGYAKKCQFSDKGGRSGGMGVLVCVLDDGTVLQVKQYKEVKS